MMDRWYKGFSGSAGIGPARGRARRARCPRPAMSCGPVALLVMLVLVLLPGPVALAQSAGTFSGFEPAGPPSPAAMLRQRVAAAQDLTRQMGLPSLGTGTLDHSHDVALPDMARMLPTTNEPQKLSSSIQIVILLSILTLAPSILLMTTCFTRVIIVMSLLRQAIGANGMPPNQVIIGLSLFITFLVMGPTWTRINTEAITPYQANKISQIDAFARGTGVLREFMIRQVVAAHNEEDVYLFYSYNQKDGALPQRWEDVGTTALIPAFILSELKVAFLMGFRIYLPFLIIDMVISSVLISIGMQLLPPVMISLPFKLLLFVLVDGWHLVTATLLSSFN